MRKETVMRLSFLALGLLCCLTFCVKAGDRDNEEKKEKKLIVYVSHSHLLRKAGIEDSVAKKAFGPPEVSRAGLLVHYAKGGAFACAVSSSPEKADAVLNAELQLFSMGPPPASVKEKFGDRSVSGPTFVMFRYRNVFVYYTWHRKAPLPLQRIRDIDAFLKTPSKEVKYGTFKALPKVSAHLKKVKLVTASEKKPSRIHLLISTDFEGLGKKPLFSIRRNNITSVESLVKSDGTVQVVLIPKKEETPLKNYPITIRASGDGLLFAEETITVDIE